jgi:hypothetical protein
MFFISLPGASACVVTHSARSVPRSRGRRYSFHRQLVSILENHGCNDVAAAGYSSAAEIGNSQLADGDQRLRLSSRACSSSSVLRQ